jgi:RNA recognition motif-containing protein
VNSKIFIGGLNYSTTEKLLLDALEKFGKVVSIRIVTDKDSGTSKGFGFATYESHESATKAIEELNNSIFDGRRIGVKESFERKRD